jgi:hypothetical protein
VVASGLEHATQLVYLAWLSEMFTAVCVLLPATAQAPRAVKDYSRRVYGLMVLFHGELDDHIAADADTQLQLAAIFAAARLYSGHHWQPRRYCRDMPRLATLCWWLGAMAVSGSASAGAD